MASSAPGGRPAGIDTRERSPLSLAELDQLPDDAPELERPLPAWVTEAHLRWLETGEGDPWGGYFS